MRRREFIGGVGAAAAVGLRDVGAGSKKARAMDIALVVAAFGLMVGAVGIWLAVKADSKLKSERARLRQAVFRIRSTPGAPQDIRQALDRLLDTME